MSILIHGGGVAAATCAYLLDRADFAVAWDRQERELVPSIMLSGAALALLRDVFGQPAMFADKRRVRRRIVQWGQGRPVILPHDAVVVSQADLQGVLKPARDLPARPAALPGISVLAGTPAPDANRMEFGRRDAFAARVAISPGAEGDCLVESLSEGWLFLVPEAVGHGWLLGFGAPLPKLLAGSSLVARMVDAGSGDGLPFETAPRLTLPLAGDDWLACGTAALRFDPICGDGTAQAVREAVLAFAVIDAIAAGGNRAALLTHYRSMLVAAMRRHLDLCARFYASGGQGTWWRQQVAELARGHEACTRLLGKMPEPRFILRDFSLQPRAQAA